MTNVYHGKTTGSFNLCAPQEKQDQVYLCTPTGNFSELFPLDDHEYHPSMLPSEVLDMIEERLDKYWLSSRRDEDKKRIAACRERIDEFDVAWLKNRILKKQDELRELEKHMMRLTGRTMV